jgi:hypothetical protein
MRDSVAQFTGLYLSFNTIALDLLYNLRTLGPDFSMSIGLTMDMVVSSSETKTYYYEGGDTAIKIAYNINPNYYPSGTTLSKDKRTISYERSPIPKLTQIRIGAKIGFNYRVNLDKFTILPFVYYNYGITQMGTVNGWRIHVLQIGADVMFKFY